MAGGDTISVAVCTILLELGESPQLTRVHINQGLTLLAKPSFQEHRPGPRLPKACTTLAAAGPDSMAPEGPEVVALRTRHSRDLWRTNMDYPLVLYYIAI